MNCREEWAQFKEELSAAERAAKVAEGGFAFAFKEGALVQALRNGDWVLLDEINLAPSEVRSLPSQCLIAGMLAPRCVSVHKLPGWLHVGGISRSRTTFIDATWCIYMRLVQF